MTLGKYLTRYSVMARSSAAFCMRHRAQCLILAIVVIVIFHLFPAFQSPISSTDRLPLPQVPALLAESPLEPIERPTFLDSLLSFPFENLLKSITLQNQPAIQDLEGRLVHELIQHELSQPKPLNDSCSRPNSLLNCSLYPGLFSGEQKKRYIQLLTFNYDLDALEIALKQYSEVSDRIVLFQSFAIWEILKKSDRFKEFEDVVIPILMEDKRILTKRDELSSIGNNQNDTNAITLPIEMTTMTIGIEKETVFTDLPLTTQTSTVQPSPTQNVVDSSEISIQSVEPGTHPLEATLTENGTAIPTETPATDLDIHSTTISLDFTNATTVSLDYVSIPSATHSDISALPTDISNDVSATDSLVANVNAENFKKSVSESDGSLDGLSPQGLAYKNTLAFQWELMLKWNEQSQYLKEDDIIGFAHVQNIPHLNQLTLLKGCRWNLSTNGVDVGVQLSESLFGLGNPTFILKKNVQTMFNSTEEMMNDTILGGIQLKRNESLFWRLIKNICESPLTIEFVTTLMQVVLQNESILQLDRQMESMNAVYTPRVMNADAMNDIWPWFYTCNKERYPQYDE